MGDRLLGADPDRKHRLEQRAANALLTDHTDHFAGDVPRRRHRGLHVHHQDRVIVRIGEQHRQRRRIALGVGVTGDVDRIEAGPRGRQDRVELLVQIGRQRRRLAAEFGQTVDRQNADAAAIGENRDPLAARRADAAERLGTVEQLAQIVHPQHAGAAERGLVHRIGTGERAGVGRSSLGAVRHAARLHHHHRLDPCRGARRRHELAGVGDGFDVEQDRAGLEIGRVEVEHVGDIDVELIADRDDAGEANLLDGRPIHHTGRNRARL